MVGYKCEICSTEFTSQNSLTLFGVNICSDCLDKPETREYVSNRRSDTAPLTAPKTQKQIRIAAPFPAKVCSGLAAFSMLSGGFALLSFPLTLSSQSTNVGFLGFVGALWWLISSIAAYATFSSIALALIYLKRITHAIEKS